MREVIVFKEERELIVEEDDEGHRINAEWVNIAIPGTAIFHCWGITYDVLENRDPGIVQLTSAIIEWPDGTINNVPTWRIQFVEPMVCNDTLPRT